MRILTAEEERQAEHEAASRPDMAMPVLLHRAGSALTQFCLANFKFESVCVVCGVGRSGAAGMVAGESLRGVTEAVSLVILAKGPDDLEPDTASLYSLLSEQPVWISSEDEFDSEAVRAAFQADLIIDAVASGGSGWLRDIDHKAIAAINDAFGVVVSADVPSGVDPDSKTPVHAREAPVVFAHGVVAFVAPKLAHVFGELTSGPIAVSEMGVQPALTSNKTAAQVITGQEVGIAFPSQVGTEQQGKFGNLLLIAGSMGKAGSAGLAALAALRTGAGAVTAACPKSIRAAVAGFAPELTTAALAETSEGSVAVAAGERIEQLVAGRDAVVVGPGFCGNDETMSFVRQLVAHCPAQLVIDVNAVNAFAGHYEELRASTTAPFRVVIADAQQAAQLLGISAEDVQSDRVEVARRIARETGDCVVLKGWRTVVAGRSGETWINMTGNPALAKSGCGDVLAGMIGAALARNPAPPPAAELTLATAASKRASTWVQEFSGIDPSEMLRKRQARQLQREAAQASAFLRDVNVAAAVYLHGVAADIARDRLHQNVVLASDLIDSLPEAFGDCDLQVDQALFYLQK